MSHTDLNGMSQEFKRKISVLTAFTSLTLIAMIAWLVGSPMLAAVLDFGAVSAVVYTVVSSRQSQGSRDYNHRA